MNIQELQIVHDKVVQAEFPEDIFGSNSSHFKVNFRHMAKMTVTTMDNQVFHHVEQHRRGSPENPVSAADVANKFNALTAPLLSANQQTAIQATIDDCDHLHDSRTLADLLITTSAN